MALNPVVIAGSLSKEELEKSIKEIVNAVDSGMNEVTNKFDTKLAAIEEKFKKAGTKIGTAFKDSFSAALGGSFDQLAAAMEKMSKASAKGTNAANASGVINGAKNENITYPEDSIGELRQQIKELQTKLNYEKKSTSELQKQVDLLHQAKAELKTQTTSRTFDSVFGMKEDSLSQISAKMRAYKSVTAQTAEEQKRIRDEYQRLSQRQKELLGTTKSLANGNSALARSFGYIRNRLVYALTIGSVMSFVKQMYSVRAEYELLERSMGVLIDNFRRGSEIFNELNAMALKSPFTLVELGTAAKQLLAYNFAEDEVVDTTRRLADISAALGVPMERLVYNLGQIKAQTVLTARDARDFANAGLAIVPMLAKMYTEQKKFGDEIVTTAQVYDMMKKKLVSYEDVMKVINQVTDEGGKFFDFQAKQAETLKVQLANLTLAWNNMLNDIASGHQTALNTPIKLVKSLLQNWRSVLSVIQSLIVAYGIYKTAILAVNSAHAATWALRLQVRWKQYTEAILAATGAMNKLKVAIGTSGIIGLASILAGVASYFLFFKDSVGEAADDIKRFGEAGTKAVRNVENLYTALSSINKTSGNYKKIMGELNQALEDYGLELVNENFTMEQLNANREKNIELLKQEALEREHLNNIEREREKYETAGKDERAKIEKTIASYGDAWKKYAPAISSIVANIFEENIDQVTGKTGHEFNQAATQILDKVREEIKKNPVLSLEIDEESLKRAVSLYNYNGIISNLTNLKLVREATEANIAAENAYNEEQKKRIGTQTTLNDRIEQSSKLLLDAANDTDKFYRKINQIVKDYSGKNIIDFLVDVKTKVPDWMMRIGVEDLSRLAARFTSIASEASKAGFKQKNVNGTIWDVSDIYLQGALYAEALRQKTAKEEEDTKKVKQKKDELGDALAKELQLIADIQKLYKEYTKAGVDSETAKNAAAKEYQKTLEQTNNTLAKFGVQGLTGEQLATMDLRSMRDYYQSILDKVQSSPKAVEALEKAIRNLNVEITKEGQKTIIDSLNSELSKLKDEYELAVELDANPELGGVFADMMGLSKEELEKLPRDFEGVVRKLQTIVDKQLGMGAFDVRSNLNKDVFDQWVKSNKYAQDSDLVAKLKAITDYANKIRQDETKKQIDDWNKLLEKYAQYQYKRTQIMRDAEREREIARKKGADSDVLNAIDLRERRELAKLDFEQFQNAPTWIAATGDLAGMTNSAIGMLIDKLEKYKKSAKNLDPKQIKQINSALKKLYSEQRKNNPFAGIANAIDEAKERFNDYQLQIDEAGERIDALNEKLQTEVGLTEAEKLELADLIGKTKKWREEQEKVGKVSASAIVEGLQQTTSSISQVTKSLGEMFASFGNKDFAKDMEIMNNIMDKTMQGASTGAQMGGGWGAAIGGIVGFGSSFISEMKDIWTGDANIQTKIAESTRRLARLSSTYEELSWEAENAYGAIVSGAKRATVESKKLQLAELERQLQLENSRKAKNRDTDKIIELKDQISDIKREIKDGTSEIINDILGISSAGDEITNLVQVMIDAFKNGEDAMVAFGEEWDKMIDNMILKLVVSEVMQREWDKIMAYLKQKEDEFLESPSKAKANAQSRLEELEGLSINDQKRILWQYLFPNRNILGDPANEISDTLLEKYKEMLAHSLDAAEKGIDTASIDYTKFMLDFLAGEGFQQMKDAANAIPEVLEQYGLVFGQDAEGQALSNLQQGIQGITEDTAGALEAYMNGVSQQVYLHSDLLTQIRDAVVGFDLDVQLGVQSQILLELQNSYQVQMSIQNILQGVLNPSGRAFMVEME